MLPLDKMSKDDAIREILLYLAAASEAEAQLFLPANVLKVGSEITIGDETYIYLRTVGYVLHKPKSAPSCDIATKDGVIARMLGFNFSTVKSMSVEPVSEETDNMKITLTAPTYKVTVRLVPHGIGKRVTEWEFTPSATLTATTKADFANTPSVTKYKIDGSIDVTTSQLYDFTREDHYVGNIIVKTVTTKGNRITIRDVSKSTEIVKIRLTDGTGSPQVYQIVGVGYELHTPDIVEFKWEAYGVKIAGESVPGSLLIEGSLYTFKYTHEGEHVHNFLVVPGDEFKLVRMI